MELEAGTDAENIEHLMECPGCTLCEYLLEFYTACDRCGYWGHKSVEHVCPALRGPHQ